MPTNTGMLSDEGAEYKRIDPTVDATVLRRAMDYSKNKQVPAMRRRTKHMKQYAGSGYNDGMLEDKTPLNPIRMAIDIYMQSLSVEQPQVMMTPDRVDDILVVKHFEMSTNEVMRMMDLNREFFRCILDAMFLMGVMKVGVQGISEEAYSYMGKKRELFPYAKNVGMSNVILDMNASCVDYMQFCATRFRIPVEAALDSGYFDKKAQRAIENSMARNGDSYSGGDEQSAGQRLSNTDTYGKRVELFDSFEGWEVWVPSKNKTITLLGDTSTILKVQDYEGPECGPLLYLGFGEIPENLMPASPASDLYDLSDSIDRLFNKNIRQAERQKSLTVVQKGSEADGKTIEQASDGQIVGVDQPQNVKELAYGGVNPANYATMESLRQDFSYKAGNMDTLGGLAPQADTAHQEAILDANSSKKMQNFARMTKAFMSQVAESIAWEVWHDPVGFTDGVIRDDPRYKGQPPVKSPDISSFKDRRALEDYHIRYEAIVLPIRTPAEKMQAIDKAVGQVVQLGPMAMGQGVSIDIPKYFELSAQLSNVPEVQQVIKTVQPPQNSDAAQGGPSHGGGATPYQSTKPANTTRTINRKVGPGTNNKSQVMAGLMLGKNVQPKEKNNL